MKMRCLKYCILMGLCCLFQSCLVYSSFSTSTPSPRYNEDISTKDIDQTYCRTPERHGDCSNREDYDRTATSSEKINVYSSTPQPIKLVYFNGRGRAEVSRLILVAAGQPFEDVRLETFPPEEKAKAPFGQLPLLEINGQTYAQSVAIATYLAREFGFYGHTNLDGLKIDQIVQLTQEIVNAGYNAYFYEPDENKKAEMIRDLKEKEFPRYLGYYEKLLKKSGTIYFVGNSLTLADLIVYDAVFAFLQRGFSSDGFPLVESLCQLVENQPNIKAYLAQRKPTPY